MTETMASPLARLEPFVKVGVSVITVGFALGVAGFLRAVGLL